MHRHTQYSVTQQILLILLLGISGAPFAWANSSQIFHVEMIVFARENIATYRTADAAETPQLRQQPIEILAFTPTTAPTPYHFLAENALQLNATLSALLLSNRYQILMHSAWLQPITAANNPGPAVHITGGEHYAPESEEDEQWQIDGLLWLTRSPNGLNVALNLLLNEPDEQHKTRALPLVQQQRTRSGELLYFDHPAYGVLLLIAPHTANASASTSKRIDG